MQSNHVHTTLRGLHFSSEEVIEAKNHGKMLLLGIDFSRECNLDCVYCDREPDRKSQGDEITQLERARIIKQATDLGCVSIKIPGAGEPLMDKNFWQSLQLINQLELIPIVYTNGTLVDKRVAKRLFNSGASVVLKFDSNEPHTQDRIVGMPGYGIHCVLALESLLSAGFNAVQPTRLGLEICITQLNYDSIHEIFRMCRRRNISPFCSSLIPNGRALSTDLMLSKERLLKKYRDIRRIDYKEFDIYYDEVLPHLGGYICREPMIGMFVNIFGDVYECDGMSKKFGNIRNNTLKGLWNNAEAKQFRHTLPEGYCPVRETHWNKCGKLTLGEHFKARIPLERQPDEENYRGK